MKPALYMLTGILIGIWLITIIKGLADKTAEDAYNAGAQDALHGRLSPVIHIEDQDTSITYKLQWPQ